jgi:hypothetical protein
MSELTIPGTMTETSLVLPSGMDLNDWVRVGETLKRMSKSIQWWAGDWLAYGEDHYGERAFQALERADQTLANWAWVCRKVEPSRRREDVSFSVHAELAPLPPDEQEQALERADAEGWTVKRAREEARGKTKNAQLITHIVCPECGALSPMSKVETREVPA